MERAADQKPLCVREDFKTLLVSGQARPVSPPEKRTILWWRSTTKYEGECFAMTRRALLLLAGGRP
jgi:hypothetical protein